MGEAGNGMHAHLSLGRDGKNAFDEHDADPPVHSAHAPGLAGLVAHHRELLAVMAPSINAYKRVEDYSFAPTQVSWGLDHRLVGVRCVVDHGAATRLEARWASPMRTRTSCSRAVSARPPTGSSTSSTCRRW